MLNKLYRTSFFFCTHLQIPNEADKKGKLHHNLLMQPFQLEMYDGDVWWYHACQTNKVHNEAPSNPEHTLQTEQSVLASLTAHVIATLIKAGLTMMRGRERPPQAIKSSINSERQTQWLTSSRVLVYLTYVMMSPAFEAKRPHICSFCWHALTLSFVLWGESNVEVLLRKASSCPVLNYLQSSKVPQRLFKQKEKRQKKTSLVCHVSQ